MNLRLVWIVVALGAANPARADTVAREGPGRAAWQARNISGGTEWRLDPAKGYLLMHSWAADATEFLDITDVPLADRTDVPTAGRVKIAVADWSQFKPTRTFQVGKDKPFFRGSRDNFFLIEVTPGTYLYHRYVASYANVGPMENCLCMGTVAFAIDPGIITYFGRIDSDQIHPSDEISKINGILSYRQSIPNLKLIERVPNWTGVYIDRISLEFTPYEYSRDRMKLRPPPPPDPTPTPPLISNDEITDPTIRRTLGLPPKGN